MSGSVFASIDTKHGTMKLPQDLERSALINASTTSDSSLSGKGVRLFMCSGDSQDETPNFQFMSTMSPLAARILANQLLTAADYAENDNNWSSEYMTSEYSFEGES